MKTKKEVASPATNNSSGPCMCTSVNAFANSPSPLGPPPISSSTCRCFMRDSLVMISKKFTFHFLYSPAYKWNCFRYKAMQDGNLSHDDNWCCWIYFLLFQKKYTEHFILNNIGKRHLPHMTCTLKNLKHSHLILKEQNTSETIINSHWLTSLSVFVYNHYYLAMRRPM